MASGITSGKVIIDGTVSESKLTQDVQNKLNKTVTVDDVLTSTSTTNALSANQGKVLKDLVDTKSPLSHTHSSASTTASGFMSAADKSKLDGITTGATKTVINNTLTSSSTTEALSANQGKVLHEAIQGAITSTNNKVEKETGKGLSTNDFTTAEKNKLAKLEELFRGTFTTTSAFPTDGKAGQYVYLDEGTGKDVVEYIWDATDNKFVKVGGTSTAETPASVKTKYESNADTNAFTDSYKSKLDGITTGATKTVINNTLTSTSTTEALSANQGKVLKDLVDTKASSSHTHNYAGSTSAGGAANSVSKSLVVKLNGGTTEGSNKFTYNGGTEKTVNITPSSIGAASTSQLGDYLPLTGGVVTGNITAVGFYQSSDERKKENIKDLDLGRYSRINELELKSYNWKETGIPDVGYIAQEVEKLYPEFVHTDENGYKSVDYTKILLVKLHMLGK